MKVITKTIASKNQNSEEKKKHMVYFFGLGESVDCNNEGDDFGQWTHNKNIDIHMFNYHYGELFSPKTEKECEKLLAILSKALGTAIAAFALSFISGSIGYFIIASKMPISFKTPIFIMSPLALAIIAELSVITTAVAVFCCLPAPLVKFVTKGKDPIKAGMAMVIDLLEKGVHPNDIILMGNSLGGGIAAEVLQKFEEENINFTLIHSNSYDSWRNVPKSQKSLIGVLFKLISPIVYIWFKVCHLNFKPNEIIKSTKSPVLATNRIGDIVIDEAAQSVFNLRKSKDDFKKDNGLKVTALLKGNSSNIHVESLTEMKVYDVNSLCSRDISSLSSSKGYDEFLEKFTNISGKYLEGEGLNKGFNLSNFKQSKIYQKTEKNKVSLIDIDNPSSKIENISYDKQKGDSLSRAKVYHG